MPFSPINHLFNTNGRPTLPHFSIYLWKNTPFLPWSRYVKKSDKEMKKKPCIQVISRKSNFIFKYPDPSLTFFIIYNFWQGAHFWWAKKSIIFFHIVYDPARVVVFFPNPIQKKTLNLEKELKNNLSKTNISVHPKQCSSRKKMFS